MSKNRYGAVKSAIPALPKWNMYAGGSTAAPGKHSYDYYTRPIRAGGRQYSISPHSLESGRHFCYILTVFPSVRPHGGHAWIAPNGDENYYPIASASYRSPQAAVSAARAHAVRYRRKST